MATKAKTTTSTTEDTTLNTPPSDLVTLSRAQLAEMIAEALQARDEDEPTGPPPGMELAKAIGDAVAEGLAKNSPKKVSYGAYLKRPTLNHPKGLLSPKFTPGRTYFQNGRLVTYDNVNDTQVELLNAITLQMGPQVMLAIKVRMRTGLTLDAAVASINALERRIKAKFPEVTWIFTEPDVAD